MFINLLRLLAFSTIFNCTNKIDFHAFIYITQNLSFLVADWFTDWLLNKYLQSNWCTARCSIDGNRFSFICSHIHIYFSLVASHITLNSFKVLTLSMRENYHIISFSTSIATRNTKTFPSSFLWKRENGRHFVQMMRKYEISFAANWNVMNLKVLSI